MKGHPHRSGRAAVVFLAALGVLSLRAAIVSAAPVLGFREDFATGVDSWQGGPGPFNPGSGGYSGGIDGYLRIELADPFNFGAYSDGPEYTGNWTAAGITQIRVWMNDVDNQDNFQIHLSIGNQSNFWQRNTAIVPPHNQWAEFTIPLDGPTGWTRIIGSGTFPAALTNVSRIHFRHDLAPYIQHPDSIAGELGIDHILLTNGTVDVGDAPAASVARGIQLAAPYPNPARGPVTLAFTQFSSAPATIEILDVTGRRVRAMQLGEAGPGPRTWMWDGLDDAGRRVAPGAYRVRVFGPDGGESRPLVRID